MDNYSNIDKELMDMTILDEFTMSGLWGLREVLYRKKEKVTEDKELAVSFSKFKLAADSEKQLYYINSNIDMIDIVIAGKELEIFDFTDYDVICLN